MVAAVEVVLLYLTDLNVLDRRKGLFEQKVFIFASIGLRQSADDIIS